MGVILSMNFFYLFHYKKQLDFVKLKIDNSKVKNVSHRALYYQYIYFFTKFIIELDI